MEFLLDTRPHEVQRRLVEKDGKYQSFIAGQLLSPLNRHKAWEGAFAVDNGAFAQFDAKAFTNKLDANLPHRDRCLFVCCPDVVGSGRRTLEVFDIWQPKLEGWPVALVAQDGIENLSIPWKEIEAIFIGGTTAFKTSDDAVDIIKAGKIAGVHVHVGRVNTIRRYRVFQSAGADTCDGSGVSRFDWMLDRIAEGCIDDHMPMFVDDTCNPEPKN